MTITVPEFIPEFDEDEDSVRGRYDTDALIANPALDIREGGFYQSLTEPSVKEDARQWDSLNDVLQNGSPLYASGQYLDYEAAKVGLTRKPAVQATGEVTFTGTDGVTIPSGTRVAATTTSDVQSSVRFITQADGVISGGVVIVAVTAETGGSQGNVTAGAIALIEDNVSDVASVSNADDTSGGVDLEEDDDLRTRVLDEINLPQSTGSRPDYKRWALEEDGIGAVTVTPLAFGAFSVEVTVLDPNNDPVGSSDLDSLQTKLTGDPILANPTAAPTSSAGAAGSVSGNVYYKYTWVDDSGGETKGGAASTLLNVTSKHVSVATIAVGPSGTEKRRLYRSSTPTGIYRLVTEIADNTTTTYSDNTADVSAEDPMPMTNNTSQWEGLAPVGAFVRVDTPTSLSVDIAATITCASGYSLDGSSGTIDVSDDIESSVTDYISSLAPGDDVIYAHVAAAMFVTGVFDISGLTVAGAGINLAIPITEVATTGTITLS